MAEVPEPIDIVDVFRRSELVVPFVSGDVLIGVLDLDSPETARFDVEDQTGLEAIALAYLESLA